MKLHLATAFLCLTLQTSSCQKIDSIYGITENNFYYKSKGELVKALSFTQVKSPVRTDLSSSASSSISSSSDDTSNNKDTVTSGGDGIVPPGGSTNGENNNTESAAAVAPSGGVGFVGCDGIDFRFEIEFEGDVSGIRGDLYASTGGDMSLMYNWSEGFLDKVHSSPYGETICLDEDKDYRFDVHGGR